MSAIRHCFVGIVLAHLMCAFFYLVGSLLWTPALLGPPRRRSPAEPGSLLEIVTVTACGMAIVGLVSFVIGMLGLIYPVTAAVAIVVLVVLFFVFDDSPLQRQFWSVRWHAITSAASVPAAVVYVASLVLAVPAVLPETAFDALFYHLVYVVDWASAHRIYIDEWLRSPYYANNWLLLDTWMFELGLGSHVDFLGALSGALSLLGVCGLVDGLADRRAHSARTIGLAAGLAAATLFFAPVFLRWTNTGMVDVPIGFFFIVSVAGVCMAVHTRDRRWAIYTILCFSFFVGMKSVFIAFIPVAVVAVWIAMRATRSPVRTSLLATGAALALCLPWYVKNVVAVGDPMPPILHSIMHVPDANWTPADMAAVAADLKVDQSPRFLLNLPLDIVVNPGTRNYREYGVSLLMLLLFAPGVALLWGLIWRGAIIRAPWFILSSFLSYAVMYWLVSSHIGRYALLFYPTLAALIGLAVLRLARVSRAWKGVAFAGLAICAFPAPAGASWLMSLWETSYVHLALTYPNRDAYLTTNVAAFSEEEYVSRRLLRAGIAQPRVYIIGDDTLDFYFKLHGVVRIGDWFGRARYDDFVAAIDAGRAVDYLNRFDVDAFILSPHTLLTPPRVAGLTDQLLRAGFTRKVLANRTDPMFFAPRVKW